MPKLQKPKQFRFQMNDGTNFVGTGKTEAEVLMRHLELTTKKIGHQLTFNEASNPENVVMIRPNAFVGPFSSFDEAARIAWHRVKSIDNTGLTEQGKKLKEALCKQRQVAKA